MLSERSIVPFFFFGFNFYHPFSQLLEFCVTISIPNGCCKEINITFYCRAPFQFNNYPSDKHDVEKVVNYDVPCASNIKDD